MRLSLRACAAVLGFGVVLAAPDLAAQHNLSDTDRAEIRAVISRQIAAFQRDDAAEAFSLASPGIQSTFRTAENFLHMVKMSYQPVYRPASVTFLGLSMVEDEAVQRVQISDSSGAL